MNKKSSAAKIELKKFDDLFGGTEIGQSDMENSIIEIPVEELYEFKNHPFKIHEDELNEMVDSVAQFGVLVPGICRRRAEGGYEILSGHTRKKACEIAGIKLMPMIIKEVSDDEAVVMMVDSNIQRENVLVSEKAKAYKMRYDATKNQGLKGNSLKAISNDTGDSVKQIQRYIWIARLNEQLLCLMDEKKLPMAQGVDISFLTEEEQDIVYEMISELHLIPTMLQSAEIKNYSQQHMLNRASLMQIMKPVGKGKAAKKVVIKSDELSKYFADDVTEKEITETIISLLDQWKEGRQNE